MPRWAAAPPAEQLNRGSAFCVRGKKENLLGTLDSNTVLITETLQVSAGGGALLEKRGAPCNSDVSHPHHRFIYIHTYECRPAYEYRTAKLFPIVSAPMDYYGCEITFNKRSSSKLVLKSAAEEMSERSLEKEIFWTVERHSESKEHCQGSSIPSHPDGDLDHPQNIITGSWCHCGHCLKFSSKAIYKILSYVVN